MNCPSCGHSFHLHLWKDLDHAGLRRFKPCAVACVSESHLDGVVVEVWDECACTEFSHAGEASRAMVRELENKYKLVRSIPILEAISTERPLTF